MTQGELEQIPQPFVELMSELEMRIMKDIIERIKANGFSPASADWEISRLQQLGESEEQIRKWIKETLEKTDDEVDKIFSDDVYREYYGHDREYQVSSFEQIPLEQNVQLLQVIEASKRQTKDTFKNLTGSTGFAIRDPATGNIMYSPTMKFYQQTLDAAIMDIKSGAFSYNTVLARTINTMTTSGLRWIDYDSGWHNRVDVAARRAVMTGFRQVQGKINEQVAEELKTDTYEVTYHVGARPTHQPWQGRVWTMHLLMEVKPTDRMTLSLTRIKSNAGRKWAHTRGWGWLVISDRFSLRQLEEHAISTNTWKLIEAELKTSRILAWREMMELRTRYEIHRLDLIAYIIQSGAEVDNFYRITPKISNNTSNQRQPNESDCHN